MKRSTERNAAARALAAAAGLALALAIGACATEDKTAKETPAPPKPAPEVATPKMTAPDTAKKEAEPVKDAASTMPSKPATPPDRVQVQHILVGFAGSVPGKNITRTQEEASKLAHEILARARKGEDFGALVREYTDDRPPGIYGMVASGLTPNPGEFPRDGMVPAFGNVGFNISPGNIDIAEYDKATSPYGWHVIKRIK